MPFKKMLKRVYTISRVAVMLAVCVNLYGCMFEKYDVSTMAALYEAHHSIYGRLMSYSVLLNPDGTYMSNYVYDVADIISDGTWRIDGKYVILNSFIQNLKCFPVDIIQEDVMPQKKDFTIVCDDVAYQTCLMYFLNGEDSVAINTDTINFNCRNYPDTINLCIEANKISGVICKSDDIIIKYPGNYRIKTKGFFLRNKPLNYQVIKESKMKILSPKAIQDVYSTNVVLKRSISD